MDQPLFHPLVCRIQPAWVIGTKACPGPRSGMTARGLECARLPRLPRSSYRPLFVIPAEAGIHMGGDGTMERGRRLRRARGLPPAGVGAGDRRIRKMNSPYITATPCFHYRRAGSSRHEHLAGQQIPTPKRGDAGNPRKHPPHQSPDFPPAHGQGHHVTRCVYIE